MKLCRFQPQEFAATDIARAPHESHPHVRHGIIESNSVHEISGELWGPRELTGHKWPLDSVKFLPPSIPSKIVCVGKNYVDHAAKMGGPPPKSPIIFLKPPSAIIAPEEPIILPRISQRVDYEGEIAIIIGRRCHLLPPTKTSAPISSATPATTTSPPATSRNSTASGPAAKASTPSPLGPLLESELNLADTRVETYVNGVRKQSASVSEMIFSIDVIIHWIAEVMTLEAGDVIATGTPAGIGPLADGDVVEVSVTGIGTLRNPVTSFQ